jgi:hypothetical protein
MDNDTLMRRWRDLLSADPELREQVAKLDGDARRRGESWNWRPYALAARDQDRHLSHRSCLTQGTARAVARLANTRLPACYASGTEPAQNLEAIARSPRAQNDSSTHPSSAKPEAV